MKKKYWIAALIVVLTAGAVLAYRTLASGQGTNADNLQTATVSRGAVASTISGVGTASSKQSATVTWQTSGKVDRVEVQIGQQVTAGDVLASLDPNTLSTTIIQAKADLITAQNDLEALEEADPLKIAEAEIALAQAKETLNDLLNPSQTAILQAEQAVTEAQEGVDSAQITVDRLGRSRGSEEKIKTAQADYLIAQSKVERLQIYYDQLPGLPDQDVEKATALSNLAAAETARDKSLATLNWYSGTADEEEIDQENMDLALAQAQLEEAQDTLASLKNPTSTDIALAQATVEDAQEGLEGARNGASEEELIIAQTRVTVAQATLDQAYLTAPFSGMITDINVLEGDLVSQGRQAFQINDSSKLFITLQVSEVDIQQVKVGQEATLTFDALPERDFTAVVSKIGLSATISQGVVNYPVTVQVTNPDESIFPGMTAAVSIVVEKHADVLVVPNQALRTSAGQRTVIVLFEGQQVSVPVTLGLTSDSLTEVTSSQLREGDTVVLNTSTATNSTTNQNFRGGFVSSGNVIGEPPDVMIMP